jgi:hypothetical protein
MQGIQRLQASADRTSLSQLKTAEDIKNVHEAFDQALEARAMEVSLQE